MKPNHLQSELKFYSDAFSKNETRRNRKFSWETTPSKTITELIKSNGLDKNTQRKRVLDLGCGDGRHSKLFYELGYEVIGVDFCEEAIKICQNEFENTNCNFYKIDLTDKDALTKFGKFDIVIDWSILDHIRKNYIKIYLTNIINSVKKNGYLFVSSFDESLPGLFKNKDYKIIKGHYSKAYQFEELIKLFSELKLIDYRKNILEDEINNYKFHTILLKNN